MHPILSRLMMAVLFMGTIGLAVWRMPSSGHAEGAPKQYFPLMTADTPAQLDPPFRSYVGVGVSDADGDLEIYTVRGDSSELTQLTHNDVADRYPAFSPNGTQIVLSRAFPIEGMEETRYQVVVVNRDGSDERVLWEVQRPNGMFQARWSPRGQHLLVVSKGVIQDSPVHAWVLGLDGSVQPLAGNPVDLAAAQWSPDGRYVSYRVGSANATKLYIAMLGSPAPAMVGDNVVGAWWSPDSDVLVLDNFVGGQHHIIFIQPDGSGAREAVRGDYSIHGWVRNGQYVVVESISDADQNFYLLPRGGGEPVPLTAAGDKLLYGFMDAAKIGILYEQRPRGGGATELYWLPFDTRIPHFIGPGAPPTTLGAPVLSQDRKRLLYTISYCMYRSCYTNSYEVRLDDSAAVPRRVPEGVYRYLPNSSNRSAMYDGRTLDYELNPIEMVQLDPAVVIPVDFMNAQRVRVMAEWRYLP